MAEVRLLKYSAGAWIKHDAAADSLQIKSLGIGAASSATAGILVLATAAPSTGGEVGMDAAGRPVAWVAGAAHSLSHVDEVPETPHAALRQLIHLANADGPMEGYAAGAYREITPSADPFPTSVIWYAASNKVVKIVEKTITYDGSNNVTAIAWKAYAADGTTVLVTVTDTITLSGAFETSRTRVIS